MLKIIITKIIFKNFWQDEHYEFAEMFEVPYTFFFSEGVIIGCINLFTAYLYTKLWTGYIQRYHCGLLGTLVHFRQFI